MEVDATSGFPGEGHLKGTCSAKGEGRGLGTYAMRLLSERYLKGHVSFTTSPLAGTKFHAIYPLSLEE